jgi:hypothetical protein
MFFPTYHTAQILLPQISTSLEPSKMPFVGKGLGLMTRLFKKCRSGWKYKIQTGIKRGQMLLFLAGTRLLKWMEIM